jgi:aspartyl-tRNA(Asn)/glutamyl-tRNA(Gln) amidotransferase subunit C
MNSREITPERLFHVAESARLKLTEQEIPRHTKECNDILDVFERINTLDLRTVKPTLHPVQIRPTLRTDTPEQSLSQEMALSNSSFTKNGYIKGPRLFNGNTNNNSPTNN